MKKKQKAPHPLRWLLEPLEDQPSYLHRKMFGCEAAYLGTHLVLVLADGKEPWNGALFPAERENHGAVLASYPILKPHPILGKWLYLSQDEPEFESVSIEIVNRIRRGDPRFGTEPKPKKKIKKQRKMSL